MAKIIIINDDGQIRISEGSVVCGFVAQKNNNEPTRQTTFCTGTANCFQLAECIGYHLKSLAETLFPEGDSNVDLLLFKEAIKKAYTDGKSETVSSEGSIKKIRPEE